jgi:hypothetical protein
MTLLQLKCLRDELLICGDCWRKVCHSRSLRPAILRALRSAPSKDSIAMIAELEKEVNYGPTSSLLY